MVGGGQRGKGWGQGGVLHAIRWAMLHARGWAVVWVAAVYIVEDGPWIGMLHTGEGVEVGALHAVLKARVPQCTVHSRVACTLLCLFTPFCLPY